MNIPENILSTLTDEQKKKVETARSPEELLALAKEAGYELSEEQLGSVSGGKCKWFSECSYCHNYKGCPAVCVADFECDWNCVKD